MIKKILYWIMVVVIVAGAVYSYQKVGFGRKIAMLYQVTSGNMAGPGGPPGRGQAPGVGSEGGHGQGTSVEGSFQRQPPMQGSADGTSPNFQPAGEGGQRGNFPPGGEGGQRPNFQPGGRQGAPPQGMGPGGSWYRMSVRNIIPYTFILAFFVLITCVIEKTTKRVFYSNS
jgi:hypothetical protein